MTFVTCALDEDYEILNEFPFIIRRRRNGYIVHEFLNEDEYVIIRMNRKTYCKHRVIMIQFNPVDNMNELMVDHINGIRTDYRLENLRWVTQARNNQNLHSMNGIDYEFIDELETNSIAINHVSQWDFENYYICGNRILYFDGDRYRILLKHPHRKQWRVNMRDIDNKLRSITKRKFEQAFNIHFDD